MHAPQECCSFPFSFCLNKSLYFSYETIQLLQGKSTPFLSPLGLGGARDGLAGTIKQVEEAKRISDRVIFERFKHIDEEKGDFIGPNDGNETEISVANGMQDTRKRKNPFEGLPSYPNKLKQETIFRRTFS